jgi:hypothetical protein
MDLISATPLLVGYNPVAICGRDYLASHRGPLIVLSLRVHQRVPFGQRRLFWSVSFSQTLLEMRAPDAR